jgi:site-specific DNA-methyltransferase (adenine-specific)
MEVNAPDGRQGDRFHSWQKPMGLAERLIRHTTKEGDTVYDPFACTGTFLFAANKLGRKGVGAEINENNAKIAFERGVIYG